MGRLKGSTEGSPRRRVVRWAFGLCVLFGLLAMHGFQAASNPADMSGVPLTSMSAGHAAPVGAGMAEHRSSHGDGTGDRHSDHHPGGQVCLAMLTLIAVAAAVLALHLRASPAAAAPRRTRVRIVPLGRPPPRPSLHRLSVLRL